MILVKVHKTNDGTLVAVCDKELIGKKILENGLQLDLTSNFYKGAELSEIELADVLKRARIINFVGQKSVEYGIKNKFIDESRIIRIKNVPHAQCISNV